MIFSKEQMQKELFKFLSLHSEQIASLYGPDITKWRDDSAIPASPIWNVVAEMYDYGIKGIPSEGLTPGGTIDGVYASAERFFHAMNTTPMKLHLGAWGNAPPQLTLRAIRTAVARMALNGGKRLNDYATEDYGVGLGDFGYLTLAEIALLANIDERSVRNAANPKGRDPLKTEPVGNRSLVTIEEARRWLAKRRGFVPTQGSPFITAQTPEYDLLLPQSLIKKIEMEAQKNGIPFKTLFEKYVSAALKETMK